ncbi:MAG: hypothetical protein JXR76_23450 [Deltaproteobacteria bacterium]|nr:hypothetical protein [Deltaproteobacteria bacterium]
MKTRTCALSTNRDKAVGRLFFVLFLGAIGLGCMPESHKSSRDKSPEKMLAHIPGSATSTVSVSFIEDGDEATCESLGYDIGFTVDSNGQGTHIYYFYEEGGEYRHEVEFDDNRDYAFSVTASSDSGVSLSWGIPFLYTSTGVVIPVDVAAVIINGGSEALLYKYDPDVQGDAYLLPPFNPRGQRLEIRQFSFCLNLKLEISTTFTATIERTSDWDVVKSAATSHLTLSEGEAYSIEYTVDAIPKPATDVLVVSGTVNVKNPWSYAALITSIQDELLDMREVSLLCKLGDDPVDFKKDAMDAVILDMDEEIECGFYQTFHPEDERELFEFELQNIVNIATVTTDVTSIVEGASTRITSPVHVVERSHCVLVEDSLPEVGVLRDKLCEPDRITYSVVYTAGECGSTDAFENSATLIFGDSGRIVSDTSVVNVTVHPCL